MTAQGNDGMAGVSLLETPRDRETFALVGALMEASLAESQAVTNHLIELLTEQRDRALATLDGVRWKIDALLSEPYAPSESRLRAALYPSDDVIEMFTPRELVQ